MECEQSNGGAPEVKKLEDFFANYSRGDGWYGPLSDAEMTAVVTRIRNEGSSFLTAERLEPSV